MAEFPDLGEHCSVSTCRQLDFLPMKCDACNQVFCKDHVLYDYHQCSSSFKKNIQVPVCPLCNQPVPVAKGAVVDQVVGAHIDNDCKSERAKGKIYTNRCNLNGCKKRELVPIRCPECRLNFCLSHRHTADHDCKGFQGSGKPISNAGAAAFNRFFGGSKQQSTAQNQPKPKTPQQNRNSAAAATTSNGQMSEDEALAMALQMSLNDNAPRQPAKTQEQLDQELAESLQREEYDQQNQQQQQRPVRVNQQARRSSDRCDIS